MKKVFLFFLSFGTLNVFAQVPMATYKRPTLNSVKHELTLTGVVTDNATAIAIANRAVNNLDKTDFFDHANANLVFIQDGKKLFPTINGEVINYKLGVWTTKDQDGVKRPHYLPLSLISKVSGNYADSAAGATNDATSYFGAPLTFRISPAIELTKETSTENKLFLGFNADLRLLTIGDTVENKLNTGWGAYGSVGLTYMGKGFVQDPNGDQDESGRYDGTWSFSALLYIFKSGGTFNKAVFGDYEKKTLAGVEMLLRFKTSKKENSKFNFLIGANNGFTKGAPNFGKWEFRIGVGS